MPVQFPPLPTTSGIMQVLAMRPWSFAVSFVPVALTATVLLVEGRDVSHLNVVLPVFGAVFAHAAANLVNTWFDHSGGLDTLATADDRILVDNIVSPNLVAGLACTCLAIAGAVCGYYVEVRGAATFLPLAAAGVGVGVFYTAKPIALKYNGLGDLAVFSAFGPIVMSGAALAMVGRVTPSVAALSIPVGLVTTAIVHANNARDIEVDTAGGATSCAAVLHRCTPRAAAHPSAAGNLNEAYFTALLLGGWALALVTVLVQLVQGVLMPVPGTSLGGAPQHIRLVAGLGLGSGLLPPMLLRTCWRPTSPLRSWMHPTPTGSSAMCGGRCMPPQLLLGGGSLLLLPLRACCRGHSPWCSASVEVGRPSPPCRSKRPSLHYPWAQSFSAPWCRFQRWEALFWASCSASVV